MTQIVAAIIEALLSKGYQVEYEPSRCYSSCGADFHSFLVNGQVLLISVEKYRMYLDPFGRCPARVNLNSAGTFRAASFHPKFECVLPHLHVRVDYSQMKEGVQ